MAGTVHATYNWDPDGGTFVTLEKNGNATTYQMGYSSAGEPPFDGANLGTLSLADGNTLMLTAFSNKTYESGHFIGSGRILHAIRRAGDAWGSFSTNFHTSYIDAGSGWKVHHTPDLTVDLLTGLTNGNYEIAVYAEAHGNFSPPLTEDNGGDYFVASFTVTEDPLPEVAVEFTDHGKQVVSFTRTTNTGFGLELFVVGNHTNVGTWNPVLARKLRWTSGNVWTGQIAVDADVDLEYKFVTRTNSAGNYCDAGNVIWMSGPNLATNIPAMPDAPYSSKEVYYYSGWTNAYFWYQSGLNTNWYVKEMAQVGPGRTGGEFLYHADGIGNPGERLTFTIQSRYPGVTNWDQSPATGGDYVTPLDTFVLQDGNVYNYWPPASVSVSRVVSTNVTSSYDPPINSREVRIYLPRGYDENTWKRYPVLYMHDGTNVFQPGGDYGCWNAETNADYAISLGLMREAIIVAVDNSTNRSLEFHPPGDTYNGNPGIAGQYGNYLIHDVRGMVNDNYRTLTNVSDTAVMGSSFGGLVSLYLGLESNAFSKIGSMSTAPYSATNFLGRLVTNNTHGQRIYIDMGSAEPSIWTYHWQLYDIFMDDGYVVNHDLMSVIGCGAPHNEGAWDQRLPDAFSYLMNIGDEPNLLTQDENPPQLVTPQMTGGTFQVSTDTLKGRRYVLERASDLTNPAWQGVATSTIENLMWSTSTLSDTGTSASTYFYRIGAAPWP
jgi:predicted alpha/beta superfamily hydrolase